MKAILVVDLPTEMSNDYTCVTITSLNSGMSFNAKLKPMPQKMDMSKTYYECGWNDCIDEILEEDDLGCPCPYESDYACANCIETLEEEK